MFAFLLSALLVFSVNAKPQESNDGRIIGGNEVTIKDFPWQVSIVEASGHFCGGSIIGRQTILTAAHCIHNKHNPDYELFIRARVGSTYRLSGGYLRSIRRAITHERYGTPTRFDNDIALLILKYPLIYTDKIQPIALPPQYSDLDANTTVAVSGWGYRMIDGEDNLPDNLNAVSVPIVDRAVCFDSYNKTMPQSIKVSENMICAGLFDNGGKDSCQGDSGGPLAVRTETGNELHGIVSWGYSCAKPKYPGVYTRVSNYINWIKSKKMLL